MSAAHSLLAVAALWSLAVITPGPNFFMAAGFAVRASRLVGLSAVAGIGLGAAIWGSAGFFGMHALFEAAPWAFLALKLFGGGYLCLLGFRLLRPQAGAELQELTPSAHGSAFRTGLLTSLTNPKSAMFVTSVFATAMPSDASLGLGMAAIAVMVSVSLLWYVSVVCLISTRGVARAYARSRRWLERAAGVIFVVFGARLIASS